MRVSLFVTCLTDLFYPDVAESVVRVLRRLGVGVDFPEGQTCCGQPAFNGGFLDEARSVASHMIEVFESSEQVVTPSASCCAMIREHYPELFEDDPVMLPRAKTLADKTFEFVEFLEKQLQVDWSAWHLYYPAVATYHYNCHQRAIGLTDEVPRLLAGIGGLEYRELHKMEQCCGFGGVFSIKQPEISGALSRDKVACIRASGADVLVCNEGGCTMNILGAAHREGLEIQPIHIAQILDAAMLVSGDKVEAAP